MKLYEVIVGNVGLVFTGADERTARQEFSDYVRISKSGAGRAGGEDVYLFEDGDPIESYEPVPLEIPKT